MNNILVIPFLRLEMNPFVVSEDQDELRELVSTMLYWEFHKTNYM